MRVSKSLQNRSTAVIRLVMALAVSAQVLLISAPEIVQAQTFTKTGTTSGEFLKIGVGSRYLAMGEAAVASTGDAFSIFWNPAALSEVEGQQIAMAYSDWILDIGISYGVYATRIEGMGVLAVGVTALNVPSMEVTTVQQQDGNGLFYDGSSYAVTAAFARELTPRFSFGGSVKYISETIFTERASAVAFDVGTMLYTGLRSLRLGMSISNLGSDLKFSGQNLNVPIPADSNSNSNPAADGQLNVESGQLPLTFRMGVGYDFNMSLNSRLTFAGELKHPNDNVQQGSLGMEYGFHERFFLRSGYKINYDEENLTLGAGLNTPFASQSNLSIDYAWSSFGRLSSVHRFSVNLSF